MHLKIETNPSPPPFPKILKSLKPSLWKQGDIDSMVRLALTESVIFLTLFYFGVLLVLLFIYFCSLKGQKLEDCLNMFGGQLRLFYSLEFT